MPPDYIMTIKANSQETTATQTRLVRAKNAASAIRHVTQAHVTCDRATTDDILACGKSGIDIEIADDEG